MNEKRNAKMKYHCGNSVAPIARFVRSSNVFIPYRDLVMTNSTQHPDIIVISNVMRNIKMTNSVYFKMCTNIVAFTLLDQSAAELTYRHSDQC